jgi:hypothetical protein
LPTASVVRRKRQPPPWTSLRGASHTEIRTPPTVNHSKEYSTKAGVNNNQAESYISRLRRAEFGVFRGMRPQYFLDYCSEMAWREDARRMTLSERIRDLLSRVRRCPPSVSFKGYYQGARRGVEWLTTPLSLAVASAVPRPT